MELSQKYSTCDSTSLDLAGKSPSSPFPCEGNICSSLCLLVSLWYHGTGSSRLVSPFLLHSFWIRGCSRSATSSSSHKLHLSSSLHAFTQLALLMIMCSTVSLAGVAYVNTPLTLLIRDRLLAASPGDEQMLSYAFQFRRSDFQMKSIPNISDFSN